MRYPQMLFFLYSRKYIRRNTFVELFSTWQERNWGFRRMMGGWEAETGGLWRGIRFGKFTGKTEERL